MTQAPMFYPPTYMTRPPRRRPKVVGTIFRIVIAFVAGLAATLVVHGLIAVVAETGGSCGGHGDACPQGSGVSLFFALPVSIFSVPLTLALLFRKPRIIALIAAIAVAGGVLTGQTLYGHLHGATLRTVWSAPYDANPELKTMGVWTDDGTLVRARIDQVVGYDVGSGHPNWTFALPSQDVLCTLSKTSEAHIGVIGYATSDSDPCNNLVALDLRTGKALWTKTVSPDTAPIDTTADYVTIGSGIVTVASDTGMTGYDEQTGAQRWTQTLPDTCGDPGIAAGNGGLATIYSCDNVGAEVAELDPATGKQLWQALRKDPSQDDSDTLVNANPLIVDEKLSGPREAESLLAYDSAGHLTATISTTVSTPDGTEKLDTDGHSFDAAPVRWLFIHNGLLVGLASGPGDDGYYATAFRLSDGAKQWQTTLSEEPGAVGLDGDHLVLMTDDDPSPELETMPFNGSASSTLGVADLESGDDPELYAFGSRYAMVSATGDDPDSPIIVFSP